MNTIGRLALAVLIVAATYGHYKGWHRYNVLLVAISFLIFWTRSSTKGSKSHLAEYTCRNGRNENNMSAKELAPDYVPDHPHVEGAILPNPVVVRSNMGQPTDFENERVKGKYIFLHKPTHDKQKMERGDYPYANHFDGKKRVWENRLQMTFKEAPESDLFFGIELEEYVPMSWSTKKTMGGVIATLRQTVGNSLHHSAGDNPKKIKGELERPHFMMPLWAFDQLIVTPPGEKPPILTDPNFANLGSKRVGRVNAYREEIEKLDFHPGFTYTFAFYGISRCLDNVRWKITVFGQKIDFNLFCGRPPVYVGIYTLSQEVEKKIHPSDNTPRTYDEFMGMSNGSREQADKLWKQSKKHPQEQRHLDSRKRYFFQIAFWSSMMRDKIPPYRQQELLDSDGSRRRAQAAASLEDSAKAKKNGLSSLFACCVDTKGSRK